MAGAYGHSRLVEELVEGVSAAISCTNRRSRSFCRIEHRSFCSIQGGVLMAATGELSGRDCD